MFKILPRRRKEPETEEEKPKTEEEILRETILARLVSSTYNECRRLGKREEEKFWNDWFATLRILEQRLYYNRSGLLPELTDESIRYIAQGMRDVFESTDRIIQPIDDPEVIIIPPAIAIIYGLQKDDIVEFLSGTFYGSVIKEVVIDTSIHLRYRLGDLPIGLYREDIKLLYGLRETPTQPVTKPYSLKKIESTKPRIGPDIGISSD